MTSQLVIFRAFFIYFFRPPDPRSEKNSGKSTNKKILALTTELICGQEQDGWQIFKLM